MKSLKKRIFDIIQIGHREDLPSVAFDIFIVLVILTNITVIFLETFDEMAPYADILNWLDTITISIFIVEYGLRIWTAEYLYPHLTRDQAKRRFLFSYDGIVDLLTILPFFFLSGAVAFRMLRVVRIFHLSDEAAKDNLWILLASLVFICWGTQAFVMKLANNHTPDAESVFVYMAISAVLLIPVALLMTDFSQPINHSFNGPYLTFCIQILNAIGAFALVYANRYGKAMIVAPLADACAPVITTAISLVLYAHIPSIPQILGIVAAISCVLIFSRE